MNIMTTNNNTRALVMRYSHYRSENRAAGLRLAWRDLRQMGENWMRKALHRIRMSEDEAYREGYLDHAEGLRSEAATAYWKHNRHGL